MSAAPTPGTDFSVTLALLAPDNRTQISFAISKHFPATGPLLVIDFVLRTLDSASNQFQDRVKLHVTVGNADTPDAQAMADRGLTMTQLQFLQGPITTRAQALAKTGQSGKVVNADAGLQKLISILPSV
jgi:hypothetical protein